ncbi:MAG TPA: hypothetical protein ENK11_02840, partial [Phycisphaerales bacterium]|nr:hypothetical protein [Phycisphaerales bacterium]
MGLFRHGSDGRCPKGTPPAEILREACDRNVPICVVRPEQAGRVPMARGRLLDLGDDGIDIEKVQIPGKEVRFASGDQLDAYFSIGRTLYHFRTELLRASEPKRLNRRMVILGMTIAMPGRIEQGDRRTLYRVPLGGRVERIGVELWRVGPEIDEDPDDDLAEQTLPSMAFNVHTVEFHEAVAAMDHDPDCRGWVADASEHGFGLRLEFIQPHRFHIFDPVLVRLSMPDGEEIVHLCEVRS